MPYMVSTVMYLKFGTPKRINHPFGTNGKLIIPGVVILRHITVFDYNSEILSVLHLL